jgi:hypothetical protein
MPRQPAQPFSPIRMLGEDPIGLALPESGSARKKAVQASRRR